MFLPEQMQMALAVSFVNLMLSHAGLALYWPHLPSSSSLLGDPASFFHLSQNFSIDFMPYASGIAYDNDAAQAHSELVSSQPHLHQCPAPLALAAVLGLSGVSGVCFRRETSLI